MTTPATVTKSIGLPADALAVMVFASPPRQFYRDGTTRGRLPGFSRQDSFIWTGKPSSVYRDFCKKPASPDTDGNSPYHRAVSKNTRRQNTIRLPALQVIKYTVKWYLLQFYQIVPRRSTGNFKLYISGDNSCCLDNFRSQPHKPANAHIKNWLPTTFC